VFVHNREILIFNSFLDNCAFVRFSYDPFPKNVVPTRVVRNKKINWSAVGKNKYNDENVVEFYVLCRNRVLVVINVHLTDPTMYEEY